VVVRESDEDNGKYYEYVCITTNRPDTKSKSNPNPNPNPTIKQNAVVSIRLNIHVVTCLTGIGRNFIRDNVIAPFYNFPLSLSLC